MKHKFDLVILGSGSTAFAAALRTASLEKTVAMTEERALGGTCVNRGCLPSKNLIEAARIIYDAAHPRYPGLSPVTMPFDFARLIQQKDDLVQAYRGKKYQSMVTDDEKIKTFYGHAHFVSPHEVAVGDEILTAERFLVATGTRPAVPNITGLQQTPYLTSDLLTSGEEMELMEAPASLIILGGGYIALELGQMFARFGTKVTIIQRGDQILSRYEPEIADSARAVLEEEGIAVHTGAQVTLVESSKRAVTIFAQINRQSRQFQAAQLLVAAGRVPNTDGLGLDKAGIRVDSQGFIGVNEELQTSAGHIWAAGDVIGPYMGSEMATPVGAQDGGIAADNALNAEHRKVDHAVIPRAIFIDPPVGVVGLTEQKALAKGYRCECRVISMELVPRAGAVRQTRGVLKMVADAKTGRVLGVSMHGLNASEVIHEAAMGLRLGATVNDFAHMLHIYPTMAEGLKIAGLAYHKDVSKLSCCAE